MKKSNNRSRPARGDRFSRSQQRAVASGRVNGVLTVGLLLYLFILATMVALDSYAFVLKSAVIPFLLAAAVLSKRFQGFVNDWAPFLGAVLLFDSLRSLEFAVTTHYEMPMYAAYPIEWERWLLGGIVAPVSAQQWRATLPDPYWLDRFLVLIHASHFLFFLLFGFALWYLRRDVFRTYAWSMVGVLYIGLVAHFIVPTIPPWLAARDYALLPPTERLIHSIYNANIPSFFTIFDINPIAAMPSLHTAMPMLCAFVALRYLGWRGLVVVAYACAAGLGVMYLGEHYAVDVLGGVLLAAAVFVAVHRWGAPATALAEASGPKRDEHLASRPIAAGVAMIALAFALVPLTESLLGPLPITVDFVNRELAGRSPAANYLLGRLALDRGDFAAARVHLTEALIDLPGAAEQGVIRNFLREADLGVRNLTIPQGGHLHR